MAFPNENIALTGKDGADATSMDIASQTFYEGISLDYDFISIWKITTESVAGLQGYSIVYTDVSLSTINAINNFSQFSGDDGISMVDSRLRSSDIYLGPYKSYDFVDIWVDSGIYEYPILKFTSYGEPYTTRKSYVYVEEDPLGTMFFNGKYYKFINFIDTFPRILEENTTLDITHTYGGQILTAQDPDYGPTEVEFLASGVQTDAAEGGFGEYTISTSRTINTRPEGSKDVNFYYVSTTPEPVVDAYYFDQCRIHTINGVRCLLIFDPVDVDTGLYIQTVEGKKSIMAGNHTEIIKLMTTAGIVTIPITNVDSTEEITIDGFTFKNKKTEGV